MSKLAVIIVNYNGFNDTVECINSIKQSSLPIKIFVIDNASSNNDINSITALFPDVTLIQSEKNLGFAGGNNLGLKKALDEKFDYIALLNNDTIVLKDSFEHLLKCANENTIVSPIMKYFYAPDEIWFAGGFINRWTGNAKHIQKEIPNNQIDISFATGCCFIAHKNIWEKIGLLDESYFMYNEDEDFSIRLILNHITIKIINNSIIYHKVGQSCGGEISSFQIYYMTRNRLRVIKKFPHYFHWTAYPFTIITRIMWIIKFIIQRKKEWIYFYRGIRDGIKGIKGKTKL